MGEVEKLINDNYNKNLKADEYIKYLEEWFVNDPEDTKVSLRFIYNVVKSGKFKGSKLLDIGSGPIVYNVASASAFYSDIVLSDYVVDMCEELKRWLQGKSSSKQFLEFPAEIEGYGENLEAGVKVLEERIRKSVKQVVRCDVLNDNIFLEEVKPEVAPPFDLIMACWVLDAVCPDIPSFVLALKRINKLLRPGGGLIVLGDFDKEGWKVGDKEFHNLEASEADLRQALKDSGFKIIDLQIIDYELCSNSDYYCLVAEKL